MDTPFAVKLLFCFHTALLPVLWMYCFRDSWTRKMWQSRNDSVFIKPFRPDTSEAAYQRYRLLSRVCGVVFSLVWAVFFFSVGGPWLLSLIRGA
jgi:hypothetical protein